MATVLEDAIIKVKIDTGAARAELKKIDEEQRKLKRETDTSKKETRKQTEEAQGTVRKAVEAVTGRPLPHSLSSLKDIPSITAGLFGGPTAPGIQAGLRIEDLISEKGAPFVKGMIVEAIAGDSEVRRKVVEKILDEALSSATANPLAEFRIWAQATERSIEEAIEFGKAAAGLDFDVNAEWAKEFWDGTQKYNYMQAQLHRYGRQAGIEAGGRLFSRFVKKF